MTRINANIPVVNLCDQHLLAEHREIVRLAHLVKSKSKVTPSFRLGKGHVLFFKDKLKYALERYVDLYEECRRRGFKVINMSSSFNNIPDKYFGSWSPTEEDNKLIQARIEERLNSMKVIRYESNQIDVQQALSILLQ